MSVCRIVNVWVYNWQGYSFYKEGWKFTYAYHFVYEDYYTGLYWYEEVKCLKGGRSW